MKKIVHFVLIVICVLFFSMVTPMVSSFKPTHAQVEGKCVQPTDLSEQMKAGLNWVEARDKALDPRAVPSYTLTSAIFVDASGIGRCFFATAVFNHITGNIDKFLVDMATLQIVTVDELRKLQEKARDPILSKIDTELHPFVKALDPKASKRVMIWFKTLPGEDIGSRQQRAFETLVQTYPAAAENMHKYGKPLGVDDSKDSLAIKETYDRLMSQVKLTDAIAVWMDLLRDPKILTKDLTPMPGILATLTAEQMIGMVKDLDVEMIYPAEAEAQPLLLDSGKTHRFEPVWNSGITGLGQTIAILESSNVQTGNSYLNYSPYVRSSSGTDKDHTTRVAAIAASTYPTARGAGTGATIMSAGATTAQDDLVTGLQWATGFPQYSNIVNMSAGVINPIGSIQSISIGFDYWAKQNNALVIVAAGNEAGNLRNPADGYNVLAVGSIYNKDTADWADDELSSFSSWRNPTVPNTGIQDREKPEVVAVGQSMSGWGNSNSFESFPGPGSPPGGTSYAAPQVSGLAALMHNKNSTLKAYPEAARAIIMASATHDILELHQTGVTPDQKDGAGVIVGDQAVDTAATLGSDFTPCTVSCWWTGNMNSVPRGSSTLRTFTAQPGQRIRVAISWWASPDSTRLNDATYLGAYKLDTDLDLRIKDPSGNYIAASTSYDNNYELVDVDALQSGTYTLEVLNTFNTSPSAPPGFAGIAFVKMSAWQNVTGWLKEVSAGCDGAVWGVNNNGSVYRWDATTVGWVGQPGWLNTIAVGNANQIWGITANNAVYRWNGASWSNMPGWLKRIAVGCDGTVWGVNDYGSVYRWNAGANSWTGMPGWVSNLSVGNANQVWAVNGNGSTYRWDTATATWLQMPGWLKQVSVSNDGDVWGVNGNNSIYHWDSRNSQWIANTGSLTSITVGNAGNVWGINSNYSIYRR